VQPSEAEENYQGADDELECQLRDAGDNQLAEEQDEDRERDERHDGAVQR